MKCKCKCGSNLFYIQQMSCCDDCDQNAAWDEETEEYTTDLKTIEDRNLERDYVSEEGECQMGTAYGLGCHIYICSNCGRKTHLPLCGEC